MKNVLIVLILAATLVACESLYEDSGIPRIRSQKQVDDYNETVSSEGEKLICTKEKPLGSNISQYNCVTRNQRDRIAQQSQRALENIGRGVN